MPPRVKRTNIQRAQIFNSFDALKGFKELLREKEKITVPERHLSEDDLELLNRQIYQIETGMVVGVVYKDNREYIYREGIVSKINFDTHIIQIVKTKIDFRNIVEIRLPF